MQLTLQNKELLGVIKTNPSKTGEELAKIAFPSMFVNRRTGKEKEMSSQTNCIARTITQLNIFSKYNLVEPTWVEVEGGKKRQKFNITPLGEANAIVKPPKNG